MLSMTKQASGQLLVRSVMLGGRGDVMRERCGAVAKSQCGQAIRVPVMHHLELLTSAGEKGGLWGGQINAHPLLTVQLRLLYPSNTSAAANGP